MPSPQNEQLNQIFPYSTFVCARCGRKSPETLLDIEAYLHHRNEVLCVDKQACQRRVRKMKKKG